MILWGYGEVGIAAYNVLSKNHRIIAYADSNKDKHAKKTEYGIPVIGIDDIHQKYPDEEIVISVGVNYCLRVAEYVLSEGLVLKGIFSSYTKQIYPYVFYDWMKMYRENDEKALTDAFYHLNDSICDIAEERLFNILKYTSEHSPFYREKFLNAYYSSDMSNIDVKLFMNRMPILYREDLIKYRESIKSDIIDTLPYYEASTSGTTGIPLKLLVSPNFEESHQRFIYKMMMGEDNSELNPDKIVSFGGRYLSEEKINKKIFWEFSPNRVYGNYIFSSFYILKENIRYYVEELERISPVFLRAYPSALDLFVKYCVDMGITINIHVKGIYLTSENTTREQMTRISNYFECGVYGQYGDAEAAIFAFTNNCDEKYYCSPIYGYVQVVDWEGNQVGVGEEGRVVVTSLSNYAMPLIKYFTGDLAVYGGVENGFTVLNKLLGRTQDFVLNRFGEKIFIIVGQLSECFLPAINKVYYWQAIQRELGKIKLRIVRKPEFGEDDANEIIESLKHEYIDTEIEYVKEIKPSKSGKRSYVINYIV